MSKSYFLVGQPLFAGLMTFVKETAVEKADLFIIYAIIKDAYLVFVNYEIIFL